MSPILVLGSVNIDLVVHSARLPAPGETVLGGQFFTYNGGKGANQAVAATRAGCKFCHMIAAVGGDDFGQRAVAALRLEGIATEHIKISWQKATGVALILVDEQGENMISVATGANFELLPEDVTALPDELFQNARVLMACAEIPLATIAGGLARARASGLRTIFNPAPVQDREAMLAMLPDVDVLTPNFREATQLAGVDPTRPEAALEAAMELVQLGAKSIVMTLGAQGCLVLESGALTRIAARRVQAVDATGAGDAFNGALAVALSEDRPLLDAARFANRSAALSVSRDGAQSSLPTREEIDALVDD